MVKVYYDRNSYDVSYEYTNNPNISTAPTLPSTAQYKFEKGVTVENEPSID